MGDIDFFPNIAAYPNAPSALLAYAEYASVQVIGATSTETALTGLSVSVSIPAGRTLRITGHVGFQSATVSDRIVGYIKEGATYLGRYGQEDAQQNSANMIFEGSVIITPSAGSHTYHLTAQRYGGSGSLQTDNNSDRKGFILVEDITGTAYPTGYTYPRGLLVYAAASGVSGLGTAATDVPNASLTITVPASRSIRLKGHIIGIGNSGVNSKVAAYIQEGATKLAFAEIPLLASVGNSGTLDPEVIHIPTAGTHTYKLVIQFNNGATNIAYVDPANGQYGYLYAEDITRIV